MRKFRSQQNARMHALLLQVTLLLGMVGGAAAQVYLPQADWGVVITPRQVDSGETTSPVTLEQVDPNAAPRSSKVPARTSAQSSETTEADTANGARLVIRKPSRFPFLVTGVSVSLPLDDARPALPVLRQRLFLK